MVARPAKSGFTAPPRLVPPRRLTTFELETLVRWFCNYMPQELRRQLMGDLPGLYMLLYPSVSNDVMTSHVTRRLDEIRRQVDVLPGDHTALGS